ncbi:MAG: hypothetical protein ACTSWN_05905 [Promethearchaeota archaeon]
MYVYECSSCLFGFFVVLVLMIVKGSYFTGIKHDRCMMVFNSNDDLFNKHVKI